MCWCCAQNFVINHPLCLSVTPGLFFCQSALCLLHVALKTIMLHILFHSAKYANFEPFLPIRFSSCVSSIELGFRPFAALSDIKEICEFREFGEFSRTMRWPRLDGGIMGCCILRLWLILRWGLSWRFRLLLTETRSPKFYPDFNQNSTGNSFLIN